MFGRGSLQFQMPSAKVAISAAASAAATAMIVRSVIRDYIPPELKHYLYSKLKKLFGSISNQFTIVIEDFQGFNPNELFTATELYLQSTVSSTRRFRVTLPKKETKISFVMERNSELIDSFNGVKLRWRLVTKSIKPTHIGGRDPYSPPTYVSELRRHELSFHKKHRELVLKTYLPFVMERAREMREEKKTLKLYTLRSDGRRITRGGNPWQSVTFDHPATFKTLAIDAGAKEAIVRDLERFVGRKELYRTVGKAWKRGYLLYGPPGTGKSSLIAAMANYLNFDIYDLELSSVRSNSLLRKILISTANRSILVVEDIDCSVEVPPDRQQSGRKVYSNGRLVIEERQVTLSGLLNFVDGLWSSCGDERIIVFTTNHKDKLDPALLRPGRMDVHIHMSYCTADGFRILCSNFLGISYHPLLEEVEAMMQKTRVTPAEVGEQLMKHDDPDISLRGLKEFMEKKQITEQSEAGEAEAAA